ncbi:hypothetical protein JG688_00013950 [Phytophthora aleatoria]|uniref:Uncharacterized protein n=1 Tax=Phytophthora aleatoria TaxID=2496075 RepID=A0A8J5J134_9STRA|nr:hypothetical protein JG688_00013950 [Phytophthora aleatoria]
MCSRTGTAGEATKEARGAKVVGIGVGHPNVATDLSLSSPPVPTRACTPSPAPTPASTSSPAATPASASPRALHQLPRCLRRLACLLYASAPDEGVFRESGDEEDFCIENDVSDDKTCDDKSVANEDDEESDSKSVAKVATPDPILEEPNTNEADLLHLHYASTTDLQLHTLKGWDAHMEDSSKYCLYDTG